VTILTAGQEITSDGGFVVYTVQVTNNDSVACADTSFDLSLSDSNGSNFYPSALTQATLTNLAPGASAQTTFRVTALANQTNGATNNTDVSTAAASLKNGVTSTPVTTTLNVAGGGCTARGDYLNINGDRLTTSRR